MPVKYIQRGTDFAGIDGTQTLVPPNVAPIGVDDADDKLKYVDQDGTLHEVVTSTDELATDGGVLSTDVIFGDDTDPTKTLAFDLSGATAGADLTLVASNTADATITIPPGTSTLVNLGATQTLTSKTVTAPILTSPVISGVGYTQVAVVDLAGAAWHTGNGTADYLSWTVPAAGVVTRVVLSITTKSSGAATADIGYTATNDHTGVDNLIDGVDIGTAAGAFDNITNAGSNGKSVQALANAKWITFHALADPTGLVGKAWIYYATNA